MLLSSKTDLISTTASYNFFKKKFIVVKSPSEFVLILIFIYLLLSKSTVRSSISEVLLGKGVLKTHSKFTGEHLCRGAISIKLQLNKFQ